MLVRVWRCGAGAVVLALVIALAAAETLNIEFGRTQGFIKDPPTDPENGIFWTVHPGGVCLLNEPVQSCFPGYSCRHAAIGSPFTQCLVDGTDYEPGCSAKVPPQGQCGGPSPLSPAANGRTGAPLGTCCPRGQVCGFHGRNATPASRWTCTDPDAPFLPFTRRSALASAGGGRRLAQQAAPRRRRRQLKQTFTSPPPPPRGTITPPDYQPGVSFTAQTTDQDFISAPTDAVCSISYGTTNPCNCYDNLPKCFCNPFKTGYGKVPPPIMVKDAGLVRKDDGTTPVPLRGINWFGFENRYKFLDGVWVNGARSTGPAAGTGDDRNCMGNDITLAVARMRLLGFNAGWEPEPAAPLWGGCGLETCGMRAAGVHQRGYVERGTKTDYGARSLKT